MAGGKRPAGWSRPMLPESSSSAHRRTPGEGVPRDLAELARTAGPIALVGLVNLSMSVTDAVLMADLEPKALTAGMVVSDLYSIVNQFAAGALGAVAAPVAIAYAAGDDARMGRTIAEGLRFALLLAAVGATVIALAPRMLLSLGVALPLPEVADRSVPRGLCRQRRGTISWSDERN